LVSGQGAWESARPAEQDSVVFWRLEEGGAGQHTQMHAWAPGKAGFGWLWREGIGSFAVMKTVRNFRALGLLLVGLAGVGAVGRAQAPAGAKPVELGGLRIGAAATPVGTESWVALRALGPQQQRVRAAERVRELGTKAARTAAEEELLGVWKLYGVTRVDELRDAVGTLDATLDEAKPWAAEVLRARRLLRLAGQLTSGQAAEKEAALGELDGLFREALRGGALAAPVLCGALDALQTNAWALAETMPPATLARRADGWLEEFVAAFPNDAVAIRRAAQVLAKLALVARWKDETAMAMDLAAKGRELDAALVGVAAPAAHDLVMAAQHALWAGDAATARARLAKLEARPRAAVFAEAGSAQRIREDWIRWALLYFALGATETEPGRTIVRQASGAVPGRPNLAELILQTPEATSPVAEIELNVLRVQHDEKRPGGLREFLFLAQLGFTVAKARQMVNGPARMNAALWAAYAKGSKTELRAAAQALGGELAREAANAGWLGTTAKATGELKQRCAGLAASEWTLLAWAAREPGNGAFEREFATVVVDALHEGIAAGVASARPFRGAAPQAVATAVLPVFGLRPGMPTTMPVVPARFENSWGALQFELGVAFIDGLAQAGSVEVFRAHSGDARNVLSAVARLQPGRVKEVAAVAERFNAQMKAVQEKAEAAARDARLSEERRRAEAARVAREAAEAEARRRAQAAAQQAQSAPAREPELRWRWCMRCAGTGTYAQYVTEQKYGRTESVQKQVRCDRCWGTGKLP
jgi:hypothetical protein